MQPSDNYHRTVWDAHGAHLCSCLCIGSQRCLTIDLHSPPRPPITPMDGRDLLTPPPRCSRHQAEACCTARITRAAWRLNEASALISANGSGCQSGHAGPTRPLASCWSTAREFGARQSISWGSERDNSTARQFHNSTVEFHHSTERPPKTYWVAR